MAERPVLVVYHGGGCRDGFCAAWLLRRRFPDAEFVAANYGDPPPSDVAGKHVYVVDFSYPRAVMLDLIYTARGNVTVLDHHKTADAELGNLIYDCDRDRLDRLPDVRFDMKKSGARMVLEWLQADVRADYPQTPIWEWLVNYTEDRDLWRHALPKTREINAALRSHPLDFEVWDALTRQGPGELVTEGTAILRAEQQLVEQHVRHAVGAVMSGHPILYVNATVLQSEIGQALAADRAFSATYFDSDSGKRIWSLRSSPSGIDVSEIAKSMGGGGHKHAAGFTTDRTWYPPELVTMPDGGTGVVG